MSEVKVLDTILEVLIDDKDDNLKLDAVMMIVLNRLKELHNEL